MQLLADLVDRVAQVGRRRHPALAASRLAVDVQLPHACPQACGDDAMLVGVRLPASRCFRTKVSSHASGTPPSARSASPMPTGQLVCTRVRGTADAAARRRGRCAFGSRPGRRTRHGRRTRGTGWGMGSRCWCWALVAGGRFCCVWKTRRTLTGRRVHAQQARRLQAAHRAPLGGGVDLRPMRPARPVETVQLQRGLRRQAGQRRQDHCARRPCNCGPLAWIDCLFAHCRSTADGSLEVTDTLIWILVRQLQSCCSCAAAAGTPRAGAPLT